MLLLSVGGITLVVGSTIERRFAIGLIAASLATLACQLSGDWATTRTAYIAIDVAVAGGALYLALSLDRFWPIWFAGFQLIAIFADVASVLAPTTWLGIYGMIGSFWAIPALLAMGIGIVLDTRRDGASAADDRPS